jgi:hypothetical protein
MSRSVGPDLFTRACCAACHLSSTVVSDEQDPLRGRRGTVFAVMTVALIVLTIVMVTVIIPWVDSVARPS